MDDRARKWWWCKTHDIIEYGWNYGDEWTPYQCVIASEFSSGPCEVVEVEPPVEKEGA